MKRPRRPRRDNLDEDVKFGDLTPWKNPCAVYAYRCAVIGLIPVVGLFTGLAAVPFGIIGIIRQKANPDIGGYAQSRVGVGLGLFEAITNAAGLACLAHGLGWLG